MSPLQMVADNLARHEREDAARFDELLASIEHLKGFRWRLGGAIGLLLALSVASLAAAPWLVSRSVERVLIDNHMLHP